MEQEKKNLAEGKKFDLETEWLVDEYKEQQEKDRIEADMMAECLAEELADDEGCTLIDMAEDTDDDFISEENDNYNEWDYYGKSGEKYGFYNGYSDDVIDDVFEGDPEATWNVD